jgi:hypothetical protein
VGPASQVPQRDRPRGLAKLKKLTSLRLEKLVVNDVLAGSINIYQEQLLLTGHLGTWANSFWRFFTNRDALVDNLATMLSASWYTQNYVGKYLLSLLPHVGDTPARRTKLISALTSAVKNDAKIVKRNLEKLPKDWRDEVASELGRYGDD